MKTLDQERASFAWRKVKEQKSKNSYSEYCNLAKSAPALVMSNGLMQTLSFLRGKGKEHHIALLSNLGEWLAERKLVEDGGNFKKLMDQLASKDSLTYQRATEESLAILRWLRHLADTLKDRS